MSMSIAVAHHTLDLLVLQDWDTMRSAVLSDPALFRNICSAIAACPKFNGMTILHAAVRFNPPLDVVAQMIHLRSHMTAATDCLKRTPLHVAAGCKASATLIKRIARSYPAACDVQDAEGKTPLHLACDSSCVLFEDQIQIDDENDPSTSNREPPNHESIAALLSISLHAATIEDDDEMSPLEHAIMSNASLETVLMLQAATRKAHKQVDEREKETRSRSFTTAMSSLQMQDDDFSPASDIFCYSSRPRKMARRISLPLSAAKEA